MYSMYTHKKFESRQNMTITQVANGWILELPKATDPTQIMTEALPQIIKAMKQEPGDLDHIMQQNNIISPVMPYIPFDTEVYVFLTFEEMMGFIKLNSDPDQNK